MESETLSQKVFKNKILKESSPSFDKYGVTLV